MIINNGTLRVYVNASFRHLLLHSLADANLLIWYNQEDVRIPESARIVILITDAFI